MGVTFMFNPNSLTISVAKVGEVILGAAAASMSLASIPTGYKHFFVFVEATTTGANGTIYFTLNNDGGAHYNQIDLYSSGAASTNEIANNNTTANSLGNVNNAGGAFAVAFIEISNLASYIKGFTSIAWGANTRMQTTAGNWTDAVNEINRIDITTGNTTFVAGSKMTVYGMS